MKYYFSDFETTVAPTFDTTEAQAQSLSTEVWASSSIDYDDEDNTPHRFYNINDYLDWVFSQDSHNQVFHNLAKFDSYFIIDALIKRGFAWKDKRLQWPVGNYIVGTNGSFTVYVDVWPEGECEERGVTPRAYNFIDSMDHLNESVSKLGTRLDIPKGETPLVIQGETLEQTLHVTYDRKGNPRRIPGRRWTWEEALKYIDTDVLAVVLTARRMKLAEYWDSGLNTTASLAYNAMIFGDNPINDPKVRRRDDFRVRNYPNFWGNDLPPAPFKQATIYNPWPPEGRPDAVINGKVQEAATYKQAIAEQNPTIRWAYKGGLNLVNPIHQATNEKEEAGQAFVGEGTVLDVNSMYPWIYSTRPLPRFVHSVSYREDVAAPGDIDTLRRIVEQQPELFAIVDFEHITMTCRDEFTPFIKPNTADPRYKNQASTDKDRLGYSPAEFYARNAEFKHGLTLTSVEIELMLETYDIHEFMINRIVWYQRDPWLEQQMQDHCERWTRAKQASEKNSFDYLLAKLMLNSPYGKLGQYTRIYNEPIYANQGDQVVKVTNIKSAGGHEDADVATAAFITAYGRVYLARTINKIGLGKFLYCDTDSIHMLGNPTHDELQEWGIHTDSKELGAWDIEGRFTRGKFIKPKNYGEELVQADGSLKWHTTCAGFTRQVPMGQFRVGGVFPEMRNIVVDGGVLLLTRYMEIRDPIIEKFIIE